MSEIKLYHGTTLSNLQKIVKDGFFKKTYFTTSIDDATEYAAMGGEWSLQLREESYEVEFGVSAREQYLDMWDMYRELFPSDDTPVVIEIELDLTKVNSLPDAGAENAICLNDKYLPDKMQVLEYKWNIESLVKRDCFKIGSERYF